MVFALVGCGATAWMAPVTGLSGFTVLACPWIMGAGPCATQVAPLRLSAAWIVVVSAAAVSAAGSVGWEGGSAPAQPSANNPATNARRRSPPLRALFRFAVTTALVMFDLRAA